MDEFRTLLNQLWIRREDDRELFYRIRRKLPDLRRTLRDQFGWEVVSTETLIRLVRSRARLMRYSEFPTLPKSATTAFCAVFC